MSVHLAITNGDPSQCLDKREQHPKKYISDD